MKEANLALIIHQKKEIEKLADPQIKGKRGQTKTLCTISACSFIFFGVLPYASYIIS